MDRQVLTRQHDAVAMQAAEWMLELQDRDVSEECLSAWQVWLAQDVRHRQAFDRLQAVQECIDAVPRLPWPSDAEVAADVEQHAVRHKTRRYSYALAASVALAIGIAATAYVYRDTNEIETAIGELRRVPLPDGSTLTAGGNSRLTVQFSATRREIRLERGEAFFEVAKDAARPFVVHAGSTAIHALGTSFNVRRTGEHTIVAVADGLVETVDPVLGTARLRAGQQLRLGPESIAAPTVTVPTAVAAWREGQRQYRAEPLADVIADLARYSSRRIVIEDKEAGTLAITGTVFERDIDKWLNSLESALPVEVRTDPDGTVRIGAARR